MQLPGLDNEEHSKLWKRINDLPYKQQQMLKFKEQLTKFYDEYNTMLFDLAKVIENYREVASRINGQRP